MTPQEIVELAHAKELPAWTRLKVRDDSVGWRALTAHEICILNELFEESSDPEFYDVARTLGLVSDANDDE